MVSRTHTASLPLGGGPDPPGHGFPSFASQVLCAPALWMAATHRCISLLLLSTCVALLLQPLLGAQGAPMEPVYPGDDATPEQMAQYVADLRRYINMLTRPRYGKRDKEDTLDSLQWDSPHAAAPRELSPMDL
nr:pancreatic prohormone isoform X1 [Microcebus murinus]